MKVHAIIPSGGKGSRTSSNIPKQYMKFWGKELIAFTLNVFQKSNLIDTITIPAEELYFNLLQEIKKKYNFSKLVSIVKGGKTRQQSVFEGLKHLTAGEEDLVVVHDAARPLLTIDILNNAINQAKIFDNAVVAINAVDTLVNCKSTNLEYLKREDILYVQTPQIFRYSTLYRAFAKSERLNFQATDESMLVNLLDEKIKFVEGSKMNFKITTDEDIKLFEILSENLFDSLIQNE